jgi:quinohemoprotein ethanol dehydrogenase
LPPEQKPTAASQLKVLDFPVEGTLALQGAGVYQEKCMMCHGIGLRAGGSAPDLRQSPAAADEAVFSKIVRGGILKDSGMPQFDLSDVQLKALRNYIGKEAQ